MTNILNGLVYFLAKAILLYRTITLNVKGVKMQKFHNRFFFLSGFSFAGTDSLQDDRERERERGHPYSILPLPPIHEYSDIYLHFYN